MKDEKQLFGKLAGRVFITTKGKYYEVSEIETSGRTRRTQQQTILCRNAEGREARFELKGRMLLQPYLALFKAEQETGLRQTLLMDLDSGEWRIYPITVDMERKFPFLRDRIDYVV